MKKRLLFAALIVFVLLPVRAAFADDLKTVLSKLDTAAANFHSTSADVEVDLVTADPIYEKDIQKGVAYYERNGKAFEMSAHLLKQADDVTNGKPANFKDVPKTYVYSGGQVKLYEKLTNQVTTLTRAAQYESWFMLGFGASGKDLADKWEITDAGPATIDNINTEQLVLVPKDPAIKKNLPKVTIWIDTARGVSLKQVFDQSGGQSRTCIYSNIKVNQPSLPADAFVLDTNSKTQFVNR